MREHKFIPHASASSIVRAFFLDPSIIHDPNGMSKGRTPDDMLRTIRKQGIWAFVDVPNDEDQSATVHFWYKTGTSPARIAQLLGHELGHISGGGPYPDMGQAEEDRADEYSRVASEVTSLLLALKVVA